MSDDDLIRRGDVLALQDRFMGVVHVEKIASLPAVTPGVKVKPLVWVENPDLGEGGFLGGSDANIGPTYHAMQDGWSYHRAMYWQKADNIEAAKAAAQADYEARILAALDLTPQPAPDWQAIAWRLRSYAVHDDECKVNKPPRFSAKDCSCGLRAALAAMEGKP